MIHTPPLVPPMMDVRLRARGTGLFARPNDGSPSRRLGDAVLLVVKHVLSSHDWYTPLVTAGHTHFGSGVMKTTRRGSDGPVVRRVLLEPASGLTRVCLWLTAHVATPMKQLLRKQDGHGLLVHNAQQLALIVQLCEALRILAKAAVGRWASGKG